MSQSLPAVATAVSDLPPPTVVFLHLAVFLADDSVLGDETFRLVAFQGQENLSEPFEYDLELHGNSSAHGRRLAFSQILGRPVTFALHYPALDATGNQPSRKEANRWFHEALQGEDHGTQLVFFNGIAAAFAMERPGVYRMTVRPALWRLTLTNRFQVLSGMNVRNAIASVLARHGVDCSVAALVGSDNLATARVQDWLQAGESDYDFLKRLMAKAHVYFFFTATARSHTVVFANRPAYPQALPGGRPLHYCSTDASELGRAQVDVVTDYRYQQTLANSAVDTVFARQEAAWEVDPLPTVHRFHGASRQDLGAMPLHQYLPVEYGGSDMEADAYARQTQDALDTASCEFTGSSACAWLRCGHQFRLTQFPREKQWPDPVDPSLEGLQFVVVHVEHQASLDGTYGNTFRSVPAGGLATPVSPQDTQQGSVLGVVVAGSGGGTVPPDWRYYDQAAFDPESCQVSDSESTPAALQAQGVCVRLCTDPPGSAGVWIKLASHMATVPELGTMVQVARAQDQSELPEIQSTVQANGSKVVKPGGWTANSNVGNNWSTSYGDALSVRFGRKSTSDLTGAVSKVNVPYQSGEYRECSYAQGASYSYATAEGGQSGLLSRSESFGSAYSEHHGAVSSSTTVFDSSDNTSTVNGTSSSTSTIGTSTSTSTIGTSSSTSIIGSNSSTSVIGQQMDLNVVGQSQRISLTGASTELSLRGASASIDLQGAGVSVQLAILQTSIRTKGEDIEIPGIKIVL